jgi:putative heme iron utilization protein
MPEINTQALEDLSQRYHKLLASQQTLLLSTASITGVPDASYAPFVRDNTGVFYIFVSEMACHTANLLNNPLVSILFIRQEAEANNLFARERAVLNCRVQEIVRDDAGYTERLHDLQDKFGEVVGILRTLPDFHLFALHPESGRYVMGFGRAFSVNVNDGTLLPV